jgi:hypothetical protein
MAICQAMLTRDEGMNGTFFSSIVTMDETWMPFFNPETKRQSAQPCGHPPAFVAST